MKVNLSSTEKVITLEVEGNKIPARIWQGKTESGIPVTALITRITPDINKDDSRQQEFFDSLQEHEAPTSRVQSIPFHLIL